MTVYYLLQFMFCVLMFIVPVYLKELIKKKNTCVKNPRVTVEYTLPPPTTIAAEIVDTEVHPS